MRHRYQVLRQYRKGNGFDDTYSRKLRCKACGVVVDLLQRVVETGAPVDNECSGKIELKEG